MYERQAVHQSSWNIDHISSYFWFLVFPVNPTSWYLQLSLSSKRAHFLFYFTGLNKCLVLRIKLKGEIGTHVPLVCVAVGVYGLPDLSQLCCVVRLFFALGQQLSGINNLLETARPRRVLSQCCWHVAKYHCFIMLQRTNVWEARGVEVRRWWWWRRRRWWCGAGGGGV